MPLVQNMTNYILKLFKLPLNIKRERLRETDRRRTMLIAASYWASI